MTTTRKLPRLLSAGLTLALALPLAGEALAQGNSADAPGRQNEAPGRNRNLGHYNAADGVMGQIIANQGIFYSGDPLEISVRFPRGAELIRNGDADAWLLIFEPGADIIPVPISQEASSNRRKLFELDAVDIEALPEGVYQLGLVITVPDGNPLLIEDWYNGMLGLIAMRGLTVSDSALPIDEDRDGEVDNDENDDGFVDECQEGGEECPVVTDPAENDVDAGDDSSSDADTPTGDEQA